MDFRCELCDFEAKSAASLGSHKRYRHGIEAKGKVAKSQSKVSGFDEGLVKRLEAVVERLESKVEPVALKCPDCGTQLELMKDSPGIFKLQCKKCWEKEVNYSS